MAVRQVCTQSTSSPSNLGKGGCDVSNPFKPFKSIILTDYDFDMSTIANVATLATYETGIKEGMVYPILGSFDYEMQNVATEYFESPTKKRSLTRMGERRMVFHLNIPLDVHKKLQSYSGRKLRVILADESNNAYLTLSGGTYKGFSTSLINAEKQEWVDSAASKPATSMLVIDFANYKEWDENGVTLAPSEFYYEDLAPLTDVDIEIVGTPTATSVVARVYSIGTPTSAGLVNKVGIAGLVKADFNFLTGAGVSQNAAIDTATDNEDGTYTLACTGAVTGTLTLVAPTAISNGFIDIGTAVTVTIA